MKSVAAIVIVVAAVATVLALTAAWYGVIVFAVGKIAKLAWGG